jgi:hypothetical protein
MIKIYPIIRKLGWHIHKHSISTNFLLFQWGTTSSCVNIHKLIYFTITGYIYIYIYIYIYDKSAKKRTENLKCVLISSPWLKKEAGPQISVSIIIYEMEKLLVLQLPISIVSFYQLNSLCWHYSSLEMFNGVPHTKWQWREHEATYGQLLHTKMGRKIQVTNTRYPCQLKLFQVLFILHTFFTVGIYNISNFNTWYRNVYILYKHISICYNN